MPTPREAVFGRCARTEPRPSSTAAQFSAAPAGLGSARRVDEPWVPAIKGVDFYENLEVIYWLHQSRRDLVLQSPKNNQKTRGTFSLRSPVRPNPIATSVVRLVRVDGTRLSVVGLDCLDGTPLIDIKPYFASTDAVPAATVGWQAGRNTT